MGGEPRCAVAEAAAAGAASPLCARARVSGKVCVRGRGGKERQKRQDSREKRRESGSEPSLSSPLQEKRETRTLQPGALDSQGGGGISVPFCRRASA